MTFNRNPMRHVHVASFFESGGGGLIKNYRQAKNGNIHILIIMIEYPY